MNVRGYAQCGLPYIQQDDDFFKRGISGAFADAVNGQFELTHSGLHGGQRICNAQAQIIMAMSAHRDAVGAIQKIDHMAEHRRVFFRNRVADRVRQIDDRRAGFYSSLLRLRTGN